ncbi:MAG: 5-formyltetrahydrofolate cyclo-ligase [Erysipelotrichaceae bacterium]|nr:5-formyltetrahydrofolate cyclo-ligase [Erysipelotrichaceae bacterium]
MNKNEARSKALKLRKNENKAISSEVALNSLLEMGILNDINHIGIYYPIGKEINIIDIVNKFPDKKFYLPITRDDISFIEYKLNDNLVDGPFNTKEPIGDIVNRSRIECFIIPCVSVGNGNRRIGYGKGYYDRYLDGYEGIKIGICYKSGINLDVICDEHDIILDYVIAG